MVRQAKIRLSSFPTVGSLPGSGAYRARDSQGAPPLAGTDVTYTPELKGSDPKALV
jgi:hypothetical protein